MSKGVTMRDIAKRLNVSAVSVSKAISGKDGVSEPVREMILKTAKEMGYEYVSPKTDAKEHYNVGVMVSQNYFSDNAFYSRLFQNLAIEFGKLGYGCMLEIIHHKNEKEGILPMNAAGKMLDGLIVLGPMSDACLNNILRMDTPYVFVDNYSPEEIMDCVVSDNLYGSHVLTNYLIDKGHRKIAFVGDINATNSIMDRYLGYLKAMMQHHLPIRQ
nr:LacI family DNA-binding transcriptional regulator [Acetatifactor sp.]